MAHKSVFPMLSQLAILAPGQAEIPPQRRPLPLIHIAVIAAAGAALQHVTTMVVDGKKPNLAFTLAKVEAFYNRQQGTERPTPTRRKS